MWSAIPNGCGWCWTTEPRLPAWSSAATRYVTWRWSASKAGISRRCRSGRHPLTVSEEVYAIGAPLQERLRGTVTRGIVSAFRRDRLTGLETIQADVSIQGGNSGGPLVDAQGNLVGLTVAGYVVPGSTGSAGLNLFIPIGDALDRLRLEIARSLRGIGRTRTHSLEAVDGPPNIAQG